MTKKMSIETLDLIRKSRFLLYMHNMITEKQNEMILTKTNKLIAKHGYVKEDRKNLKGV